MARLQRRRRILGDEPYGAGMVQVEILDDDAALDHGAVAVHDGLEELAVRPGLGFERRNDVVPRRLRLPKGMGLEERALRV